MRAINNRLVVDLNKVQYAVFKYWNQHNQCRDLLPHKLTIRNSNFDHDAMHLNGRQTMLEFAIEHKLLDVWIPVVKFQLTANHSVSYSGNKAKAMWKEWNSRIFKK